MTELTIILAEGTVIKGAYGWAEFKKMWMTGEYKDGRRIKEIWSPSAKILFE